MSAPRIADVIAATAETHGLTVEDLRSDAVRRRLSWPRQEAYWLARHLCGRSAAVIGRAFGGRDHSTILHGIRQVDLRLQSDPIVSERLLLIASHLKETARASADPVS